VPTAGFGLLLPLKASFECELFNRRCHSAERRPAAALHKIPDAPIREYIRNQKHENKRLDQLSPALDDYRQEAPKYGGHVSDPT